MIQLVIIGNGFDLAHGSKTKYSDFFVYLIKRFYNKAINSQNQIEQNEICTIRTYNNPVNIESCESISKILELFKMHNIELISKHVFIHDIIRNFNSNNWADLEYLFFDNLARAFNSISRDDDIKQLNSTFSALKSEFIEYLKNILPCPAIDKFKTIFRNINSKVSFGDQIILLNFNYTDTLSPYYHYMDKCNPIEINIHGKIENPNSIIFGYGDESDARYREIEKANQNYFLDHFKSFHYIQSNDYTKLFDILENDKNWFIHVIGHSCGVSDRILLKELFDNDYCKKITIYPYKKKDGTLDVTEKVQQISRHFTGNSKHKMRRIISYDKYNVI